LARNLAKTFSAAYFMQELVHSLYVTECQLITYVMGAEKAALDALHKEPDCHAWRNGIEAIFVAVPVVLHNKMRVKNTHAADRANRFILRPVNVNLLPCPGAPCQFDTFGTLGAGKIASVVAAVRHVLAEVPVKEDVCKELRRLRTLPVLEVIDRENVEFVHIL